MPSLIDNSQQFSTVKSRYHRQFVIDRHINDFSTNNNADSAPTSQSPVPLDIHVASNSLLPRVEIVRQNLINLSEVLSAAMSSPSFSVGAGKFILCRSVGPAYFGHDESAVNFVVDDPEGQLAMQLKLYNFNSTISPETGLISYQKFAPPPPGTIFAIMNPFCVRDGDDFHIECRNPQSHFSILSTKHHPLFEDEDICFRTEYHDSKVKCNGYDALMPKDAGVKWFSDGNYIMAIACFSRILEQACWDGDQELMGRQFANRAACHLMLGDPQSALDDAEKGLECDSRNFKLAYRKAKALLWLRRYDECMDFVKIHEEDLMKVPDFPAFIAYVEQCHAEAVDGIFDVIKMINDNSANNNHVALYMDESLLEFRRVRQCDGRAVIAKQDIAPGTLLIAERALAFEQSSNNVSSVIHYRISTDKNLREALSPLDDDNDIGSLISSKMVSTRDGIGFWLEANFARHSCVDTNCSRFYVRSFLFVRASKEIKAGSELLINYLDDLTQPIGWRQHNIKRRRGACCQCRLCDAEQRHFSDSSVPGEIHERFNLIRSADCQQHPVDPEAHIVELTELLEKARRLSDDNSLNMLALKIAKHLGKVLRDVGRTIEAAPLLEEAIDGFVALGLSDDVLDAAEGIADWHPDNQRAVYWQNRLKPIYAAFYGDECVAELFIRKKQS